MRKAALPLVLAIVLWAPPAAAQSTLVRIGYLGSSSAASDAARTDAFRKGLLELGYVEGKNVTVQWRYPEGGAERLQEIAAELARLKVQVIVVSGATATQAVKRRVKDVPVVMTNVSDPVGLGLVASLAKPGGNITGMTNVSPELGAKRVQFIKTLVPNLSRLAVIGDPTSPAYRPQVAELEAAARRVRLQLQLFEVRDAADLEKAFPDLVKAGALIALQNPTITRLRARIAELATRHRLPAIYPQSEFVDAGGLISYGADIPDLHRRAAYFVDRILKGARPAELPVEQPVKYELAINARSATRINLAIPADFMLQADRIVR